MSAASAPVQVFCGSRMPIRLVYEEEAVAPPGRPAPAEQAIAFDAAARVADPRDNCAIATRDLPGGALLSGGGAGPGSSLRLSVSILEGTASPWWPSRRTTSCSPGASPSAARCARSRPESGCAMPRRSTSCVSGRSA